MKKMHLKSGLICALGIVLVGAATRANAQDVLISHFDNEGFITNNAIWSWWGGATRAYEWDGTKDASNSVSSGSLKITVTFAPDPTASVDNQYALGMSLSGSGNYNAGVTINPVTYTNLEFDILWDTNSTLPLTTLNTGGDPQGVGFGLATPGWGQSWFPGAVQPRPAGTGTWEHVVMPLNPTWSGPIPGLVFKKWFGNTTNNAGTMTFWMDNIVFKFNNNVVVPKPTMALAKAVPGLTLTSTTGDYQRQGIQSVPADGYNWYDSPDPMTYSMTFSEFSAPGRTALQGHIFLAPNATGNGPDYGNANAIMLDVRRTATGGSATLRIKTNQPNGNTQLYSTGDANGQYTALDASSVLGTWSLKIQNQTNFTISGPGGASTNIVIPAEKAAQFGAAAGASSMGTYFGIQPNPADVGQSATLTNIKVTSGTTTVVDERFDYVDPNTGEPALDINLWNLRLDGATGLRIIGTNEIPAYWLTWSIPDPNYTLQAFSNFNSAPYDPGITNLITAGGVRKVFVGATNLPSATQGYFRLVQTNAP